MSVLGKKRDEGRLRQHGEALGGHRGEHGGLLVENEKRTFARAGGFHDGGEHAARCFCEIALGRQLRPEIGESFHRAQQPAEIICFHVRRGSAKNVGQNERNMRETRTVRDACWLVWC